ncbi:MAG TPA: hypothetical protein ENK23_00150, partial [Sorangium sp.]|nr:hypothetical protein [Sorangium sp.]
MMHHTHHRGAGRLPLLVALLLAAVGCGQDGRDINIEITLGHESDAFQQQPAVTKVVVEARLVDNAVFARAETTPGGSFELGQLDSGVPLHFEVTGYGD